VDDTDHITLRPRAHGLRKLIAMLRHTYHCNVDEMKEYLGVACQICILARGDYTDHVVSGKP
jgi:hypothetical protein